MSKKIIFIFVTVMFLITVLFVAKIKFGEAKEIIIQINNEKIILSKDDKSLEKELQMFNSEKTEIKNLSNITIYIDNKKLKPNEEIELKNIEINKENKIDVKVKFADKLNCTVFKLKTQPDFFIEYDVVGESKYDGDYYLVYNVSGKLADYLVKLNEKGQIVFYKKENNLVYNFKKIQNDDHIRYSYLKVISIGYEIQLCDYIILDENYNEIDRVNFILPDGEKAGTDFHDSIYIEDGNYILVTYQNKKVDNMPSELGYGKNMNVQNCMIQEIKNGKILWQFESVDYPELYKQYSEKDVIMSMISEKYYGNYTHFNSYQIDEKDGNLICSFRNLDEIIKIDRKTGKIIWTLGGSGDEFGLTEEQKFSKQHSISFLKDHTILIYDNGATNHESRIVKVKLDEEKKKIKKFESYPLDVYSVSTGSVQAIDENEDVYLVCYGKGDYRGKYNVEEINLKTGEKYFKFNILNDDGIENILKIK